MSELPFEPHSDTLKKTLLRQYMIPAARWLLGKSQTSILAQESNSNWESALSIMYLSEIREILTELHQEKALCTEIETKCANVARWLLDRVRAPRDGLLCWDYVTWDTSVVLRALLLSLKLYEDKFSTSEVNRIIESTKGAMKWLYKRFYEWEKEVKYPFGPADVAQILITALLIEDDFKDIAKALNDPSLEHKNKIVIKDIAKYLLHIKKTAISTSAETVPREELEWWGDFYQTAEVLESLSIFYKYCKEHEPRSPTVAEIEKTLTKVLLFLDSQQFDGMWGTHVDTMRVVYAIVKVSTIVPIINPEPHLVFKALRWICDEKQRLEDGSFLHTMFLTIFMCQVFMQIYKNWTTSAKSIAEIYDDCLWSMPARTTPERTKRFAAELRNLELERELNKLREEKSKLTRNLKLLNTDRIRILIAFSLSMTTIFLFFLIGISLDIITISVLDKANCIELIGVMLAIFASFFILLEYIRRS